MRRTIRANIERHLNWMPRIADPANEKSGYYRQQCPGLVEFADLGSEVRGAWWTGEKLYVVSGSRFYRVESDGTKTQLAMLRTSTGPVDMVQGLTQLAIVDGTYGYVMTLATETVQRITSANFYASDRVAYLDTFFIFGRKGTDQFFISAIDDATTFDGNDFTGAFQGADKLIAHITDHRELWLFGTKTTAVFFNAGGEFPFQRNNGAAIEVGCIAPHTVRRFDNSLMWLGQDANGVGIVWRADGYRPVRVSSHKVEESLEGQDLEDAVAWCYQQDGQTFYCLRVPGANSTWVYDASTRQWHERAEWDSSIPGDDGLSVWRPTCHAFAHGLNLVGAADGKLYRIDLDSYEYGDDAIYREWTSLHAALPTQTRVYFSDLKLDVTVGESPINITPRIELQYSDDGGVTWGNWLYRDLGGSGEFDTQVRWSRLGASRDRVWRFRCTDNAKASIIGLSVTAVKGAS